MLAVHTNFGYVRDLNALAHDLIQVARGLIGKWVCISSRILSSADKGNNKAR